METQVLYKANTALTDGDFAEAAALYSKILADGEANGAVHYNMGIAQFRSGQIGEAIYHFKKANLVMPRNPDVKFNLDFVRRQADMSQAVSGESLQNLVRSQIPLSTKESAYGVTSAIIIWSVVSILMLYVRDNEFLKWLRRLTAGGVVITALLFGVFYIFDRPFGVVTVEKANVYSSSNANSVLLFKLNLGTEFEVGKIDSEWAQVKVGKDKKGWIATKNVILDEKR